MDNNNFLCLQSSCLPLSNDAVDIWCASLDRPLQHIEALASQLSADEQARADRFFFERDRNHFIVGRGLLRAILGRYLEMEPSQVHFFYGQHGKPMLKTGFHDKVLEFSLSHSEGLALYAVSWNRRVGVDVEHIRPIPEAKHGAERFFSPSERAVIRSYPKEQWLEVFFHAWTQKEAYIKATGVGVSRPFTQIEVSLVLEEAPRLVSIYGEPWEAGCWRLEPLRPAPSYLATLAVEGHDWQLAFPQLDVRGADEWAWGT